MSRLDVLRSFVRGAAERASDRLLSSPPVTTVRRLVEEVKQRSATLRDEALTAAVAHAPGVSIATVHCRDGAVHVDASFTNGDDLQVALLPAGARFAPRGAKEILFRVLPPEAARSRYVADVASAIAGAIAHGLWGIALPHERGDVSGAIVEREGSDALRVDLRTVPAVRGLGAQSPAALVVEVIELLTMEAVEGALRLRLKLPPIGP